MKTREGLVSNSSTTSFIVYGARFDGKSDTADEIEGALWKMERAPELKDIDTHSGEEGYSFYIGRDWERIPDDETPRSFKQRTEEDIKTLLGAMGIDTSNLKFGIYSESWYNG